MKLLEPLTGTDGRVEREDIVRWFPHFAQHHQGTKYQLYLEPSTNTKDPTIYVTVFYREPGKDKWKVRVDAEFESVIGLEGREPEPKDIRIRQWGPATKEFYQGGIDRLKHTLAEQERLRREGVPL